MSRFGREASVGFGVIGLLLSVVYSLQLNDVLSYVCIAVVALGSISFTVIGPRLHRPVPVLPWRLLTASSSVFLVGVLLRPWSADQAGAGQWVADSFTLAGYVLMVATLVTLNQAHGPLQRHALADGLIVCLGAGLLISVLFVVPAMSVDGRPMVMSMIQAVYPLIDILLLLLLLNLAFTTASRLFSYRAFVTGMAALLVGDFGYAWIGARGDLIGSPLLDLPFLLTYTSFGVAAIHPSMAWISRAVPNSDQPWSLRRCR